MADARKTWAQLDVLFGDNTAGAISPQDLRDGFQSLQPHEAAAAPTVNDDETAGFDVGHKWVDTSEPAIYECRDGSTGAAIWTKLWPVSASAAWGTITGTIGDQTDLAAVAASGAADDVSYDNASSGLTATDVQGAIDEIATSGGGSGDMTKAVYDTNDDGTVDSADEAARVVETVVTDTDSTATHAFDLSTGTIHELTLTANCTVSFTNVPAGGFGITLILIQDATGSRTVTWPAAVQWEGGTAPTLTTTANAVDIVTLFTPDGGTTWYGFLAGLDFS